MSYPSTKSWDIFPHPFSHGTQIRAERKSILGVRDRRFAFFIPDGVTPAGIRANLLVMIQQCEFLDRQDGLL